ncbi:substrate-binding domain-containing protein [Arthrobacter sp. NA-172]|uniref:substrate-binding domain-containing protein n=1 Tax=Arthrobacter sp. NA-172 TaxID=3367524 RepID=UPI003754B0E3
MARLLGGGYRPDGIVTANTPMAIGAIRALKEAGFGVPADVAVPVKTCPTPSSSCRPSRPWAPT